MFKKIYLIILIICLSVNTSNLNAIEYQKIMAYLASLMNIDQKVIVYVRKKVNDQVLKCACGEASLTKLKQFNCCKTIICDSCLTSRRHTALINKTSPKCHGCGKSFDYDMVDQKQINNYRNNRN